MGEGCSHNYIVTRYNYESKAHPGVAYSWGTDQRQATQIATELWHTASTKKKNGTSAWSTRERGMSWGEKRSLQKGYKQAPL